MAFSQRHSKAKLSERFAWNGLTPAKEHEASNNFVQRFFAGGFWFNNANYFYLTDHLGSVRQVTDSSGNVVARFEYDPYGRRTQTYGSLQVDIGFTGHFHHGTSGLILAPLRFDDPETGRWISRDPIQERGGLNLYAYCGGDPINQLDILKLRDYSAKETQEIFALLRSAYDNENWITRVLLVHELHKGAGLFDFKAQQSSRDRLRTVITGTERNRFCLRGQWIEADEFEENGSGSCGLFTNC